MLPSALNRYHMTSPFNALPWPICADDARPGSKLVRSWSMPTSPDRPNVLSRPASSGSISSSISLPTSTGEYSELVPSTMHGAKYQSNILPGIFDLSASGMPLRPSIHSEEPCLLSGIGFEGSHTSQPSCITTSASMCQDPLTNAGYPSFLTIEERSSKGLSGSTGRVTKAQVVTPKMRAASERRRTGDAKFSCPVETCKSTFTKKHNLECKR
jgi:hypothetical protein